MTTKDSSGFVERLGRGPLAWSQPDWKRAAWELRSGDTALATLTRPRRWTPFANPRLVATSPGGGWEVDARWTGYDLRPAGEPRARITFRGLFGLLTSRGRVTAGGDEFSWLARLHLLRRSSYELRNRSDFPLLIIQPRRAILRAAGTIEVTDTGRRHPQIEPLVILCWALAMTAERRGSQ